MLNIMKFFQPQRDLTVVLVVLGCWRSGLCVEPDDNGPVERLRVTTAAQIRQYEAVPGTFAAGPTEIWAAAVSADGQFVATGGADGRVRLYDRASRQLVQVVRCHTSAVTSLSFSADGSRLATASHDRAVCIWRVPQLQCERTLAGHTNRVLCVAWSPDQTHCASCGYDGTIRLWQVTSGELVATSDAHAGTVRWLAFSPDGTRLASAGDDRMVRLHATAGLGQVNLFEGHAARVRAVAFAPGGRVLASVGEDGATRLWNLDGQPGTQQLPAPISATRVAFSSAGSILATGYRDGSVWLFDAVKRQKTAELLAHSDAVSSLMFVADDQTLYSGGYDGRMFAWNARLPAQPVAARRPTRVKVWAAAFSPQGHLFAAAGRNGRGQIWDLASGRVVTEFAGHPSTIDRVRFSRDASLLAAAGWRSGDVTVWQVTDGAQRHAFKTATNVRSLAFSPDGRRLAVACEQQQLVVWDLYHHQPLIQCNAHRLNVYDVAYSPAGNTLVTCSGDWQQPLPGVVKVWQADSLRELAKLTGHATAVRSVAFRPDGQQVAAASDRGVIKIWDLATRLELATLRNSDACRMIAYSANGQLIAAAIQDGTVNVWDAEQGALIRRLQGDDDIFSVSFTADDSVIGAVGGGKTALFWDLSDLCPGRAAKWIGDWNGE